MTDPILLVLVLCRLTPIVVLVPYLGGRAVPIPIRAGIALILGFVLAPVVASTEISGGGLLVGDLLFEPGSLATATLVLLAFEELLIGLILGIFAALLFYAGLAAGRLIDQSRGYADGGGGQEFQGEASPTGLLLFYLFVVLFLVTGGHRLLLWAFVESYGLVPVGSAHLALDVALEGVLLLGTAFFALSLVLAAPVLLAQFAVDLIFGLTHRLGQGAHQTFMNAPIKALVGVAVLTLVIAFASERAVHEFEAGQQLFDRVLNRGLNRALRLGSPR